MPSAPPTDVAPNGGIRRWWIGLLISLVLLGIGVQRAASRQWRTASPDSQVLLERAHARLRKKAPTRFAAWTLFPTPDKIRRGPAPAVVRAQYDAGADVIRRAAPPSVQEALQVQWAWHSGLRKDAYRRAVRESKSAEVRRARVFIEAYTGWTPRDVVGPAHKAGNGD